MPQAVLPLTNYAKIKAVRFFAWKIDFSFLLVVLLTVLLVTLAALQYRWIGELSENDREGRRKNVTVAAENLSREFDREITRAFFQLQVDLISLENKSWDDFSARYERWQTAALYPKMVSKIFVADKSASEDAIRLSVYNEITRSFEESRWLPHLAVLQNQIGKDLNDQNVPGNKKSPRLLVITTEEIKALVIPISAINLLKLDQSRGATHPKSLPHEGTRGSAYTIVLFDSDYIKNELLPLLVARYFNFSDDADFDRYDVIVTNHREPSMIFYQSGPFQTGEPFKSDIEQDFFTLRFNEMEKIFSNRAQSGSQSLLLGSDNELNGRVSVRVNIDPLTKTDSPNKINSLTNASLNNGFEPQWRLIARHQNGSLEEAVERTRRRNLLASFGILLLLGSSGILLIVLSNRSRDFARQQTDFVASVTHELRTPLSVIRSMSENLADGIVTDGEKIRQYGSIINDEEHRLSTMLEQMLGFAGAQKAQNSLSERRPQNVAEIIEMALEDYRTELIKGIFHVEMIIESELPLIMANADALRRAIGNLISNAIKYSAEKRSIEITARAIRGKKSEHIEIIIRDEGVGIEPKDLPNVFKLFYRGSAATEGQIEGSGIGLNLVKQIVEEHNGTISVASSPEFGTTFTLILPAVSKAVPVDSGENLFQNK